MEVSRLLVFLLGSVGGGRWLVLGIGGGGVGDGDGL
jgi:hypothetical protein